MNRFKVGDKVIVRATKGGSNDVFVVNHEYEFNVAGSFITMQAVELSDGSTTLSGNLELWCHKKDLNGDYKMKKIEMGKKYKTLDGRDVEIIAIRPELEEPVIGIIENKHKVYQWSEKGIYDQDIQVSHFYDLVEVNPYADFKIDDKVLVKKVCGYDRYHYAGLDEDGNPTVFANGESSFTTNGTTLSFKVIVKFEGNL